MENFKMTKLQIMVTIDTEAEEKCATLEILNKSEDLTFRESFFLQSFLEISNSHFTDDAMLADKLTGIATGVMRQKGISTRPQGK